MKPNNRAGVVVSIVFLSVAALVVAGLVAAQALGWNIAPQEWSAGQGAQGAQGGMAQATAVESAFGSVEEIVVDVADADVTVVPSDGAEVTVHIAGEDIYTRQSGARLRVEQEESFPFSALSFARSVEIRVPEQVTRIGIETASGGVDVSGVTLTSLEADTASGRIVATNIVCARGFELESTSGGVTAETIQCEEFDVSSTSGEVRARNIFVADWETDTISSEVGALSISRRRVAIETVSGSVDVAFDRPVNGTIETVSGSVDITAPREQGFRLSSLSGSIRLFGESIDSGPLAGKTDTGGEGRLSVETVSGSITIDD